MTLALLGGPIDKSGRDAYGRPQGTKSVCGPDTGRSGCQKRGLEPRDLKSRVRG